MNSRVKGALSALTRLTLLSLAAVTIAGFIGRYFWFFDLLSHFRVQYLWLLVLVVGASSAQRMWRWTGVAAVFLAVNLATIAPLFLASPEPSAENSSPLSLLVFNINSHNRRLPEVVDYVANQKSDVIVIIEAPHEIESLLSEKFPSYEIIAETREDSFGMLVLSRLPIISTSVMYFAESELPAIQLEVEKEGARYEILGLHTMPPMGAGHSKLRDRMLEGAAQWAQGKTNALVVGDLNATPWSHAFQDLLETGELANSQCGFGVQGSWPSGLWPFAIPIDHALHGAALTTVDRDLGPFLGSDHRALRLRIGLALDEG